MTKISHPVTTKRLVIGQFRFVWAAAVDKRIARSPQFQWNG